MEKQSVVIVGAGIAGIATAISLAKNGFDVTVYEKNVQPGGRCSQLVRNGHRFDLGATILLMPSIYREVFGSLGLNFDECFDLKDLPVIYKLYFANGEQLIFSKDDAVMKLQLEAIEPRSFNRYKSYIAAGYAFFHDSYKNLLSRNFYSLFEFATPGNLMMLFRLKVYLTHMTFVRQFFKNKNLQQAFTFQNIYVGQNPLKAPALFSMLSAAEMVEGALFPVGGMFCIPTKLESVANDAGVKFVYNKVVTKIETEGNRVKQVICDDGTTTKCDLIVVNADLPYVYEDLLDDKKYSSRLAHKTYACSAIVFHWGLSKPYPQLEHHSIFVSKEYSKSLGAIFDHHSLSENPSFYIHAPVRTDPTAAPANEDSVSVIVPAGHLNVNNPQDWEELKRMARSEVLRRLKDEGFDDFEAHIKFEICYTPMAWKSIYNVSRGSVFGSIGHSIWQMGYFRPHNRHKRYCNLYFAGGSTHPGNGVPLVLLSAKLTSERIMKENTSTRQRINFCSNPG
jgi:phytoene desaturase